uniref:Glucosidase alpha, acid n=1 Tax=Malurus cyaneus samueli TaxID=2593467 RepID=A0A8C5UGC3_9PASS
MFLFTFDSRYPSSSRARLAAPPPGRCSPDSADAAPFRSGPGSSGGAGAGDPRPACASRCARDPGTSAAPRDPRSPSGPRHLRALGTPAAPAPADSPLSPRSSDAERQRYEVPLDTPRVAPTPSTLYGLQVSQDPFGLVVCRQRQGTVLLNTTVAPLFFTDQFLQISTSLPSRFISGLGEHLTPLVLDTPHWHHHALLQPRVNLYGSHPFYLVLEDDGSAHGVFLLNSNAMDVLLQPSPALTWRTTGGILDFYIFLGPDPKSVVRQYLDVVGTAEPGELLGRHCRGGISGVALLGWHCRDGIARVALLGWHCRGGIAGPSNLRCSVVWAFGAAGHPREPSWPIPVFPTLVTRDTLRWWECLLSVPPTAWKSSGHCLRSGDMTTVCFGDLAYLHLAALPFHFGAGGAPDTTGLDTAWTKVTLWNRDMAPAMPSVPSAEVLLFNLFGVPLVGADICGFLGDTSEELCVRWTQLGAFYPFMRNHNDHGTRPQEPYSFSPPAQAAMRNALRLRYALLPFLYTLFHRAHSAGDTVARPLFLEFPTDPNTWIVDRQLLWGGGLLVTPVLEPGQTKVSGYFPAGTWYSLAGDSTIHSKGQWVLLPAPLDTINVHVRAGHILPLQEPAFNTAQSRGKGMALVVALTPDGFARGDLFWDDGESWQSFERGDYTEILFLASNGAVLSQLLRASPHLDGVLLEAVTVLGVTSPPRRVLANGAIVGDFSYRSDTQVLRVPVSLPMWEQFVISWS